MIYLNKYFLNQTGDRALNIIVVGSGTVGTAICLQLIKEGHNVTVVDSNESNVTEISNICDANCISGSGANIEILKEAGAEDADLLIAVTQMDEINMLCCHAAKKLGTANTIARVRNPEYTSFMQLMKDDMNLSLTINPEKAAAKEIYRILRFPFADKVNTFCDDRVEIAEFTVGANSPLCGLSLFSLREKMNLKFLVCGVMRGDSVSIPTGDFVIKEGDTICVTASEEELVKFFKLIRSYRRPVKKIIINGGGRTTYYLGKLLGSGIAHTTIIEKNPSICRILSEELCMEIINGDGTRQDLLLEEGIENADAFLALSETDEENALVSMYAKKLGVPRIITMIRSLPYIDFFKDVGIESIVSPKSSTVDYILSFVRGVAGVEAGSEIESLHTIMDGRIEALEFIIKNPIDGFTDIPLSKIRRIKNSLIACIVRNDNVIIPSGNDTIKVGDRVIVMATDANLHNIKDILS